MFDGEIYIIGTIKTYIEGDIKKLRHLWPNDLSKELLCTLEKIVQKADRDTLSEIRDQITQIEELTDDYFSKQPSNAVPGNIIDFLHPKIVESSYTQFRSGLFRDAVFNAFVAVFDLIREKTKIDRDGADLVAEVFSLAKPKLVFSSLKNASGINEQKGFIQILQGAYQGIRNPKAHSLETDLNEVKTIQYLVFASLLVRRVDEARKVKIKKKYKI
ncbi:TIGR02391 family protein [bacterium]|nr:MAG: TIGR02391 family protein [bacterium]